jgi:predicted O-methyltransferase YrrM
MTPKEKAQELVGKCFDTFINDENEHYVETAWKLSKQCALIAVDEILDSMPQYPLITNGTHHYWMSVKNEIQKL